MGFCLNDLPGVGVGHISDGEALTGCTAIVFPAGAVAGHVAFGPATGSRELAALTPRHVVERIHGIGLAGGSAYGLAAAGGVMRRLEVEGIGHDTSFGKVPIVAGAVVYDINLGDGSVRPDEAMGEAAAEAALAGAPAASGNVGAGTGVCAGKVLGPRQATKTGLGNGGVATADGLLVGALVVVNPVGDVLDPDDPTRVLAGTREAPGSPQLVRTAEVIRAGARCEPLHSNTTLCVVATNAALTRVEAGWVAEQAMVGVARLIDPPFTRHDGDIVFCASLGDHRCDIHRVGLVCRDAVEAALGDACRAAAPAGGLPNGHGLLQPPSPKR